MLRGGPLVGGLRDSARAISSESLRPRICGREHYCDSP